MNYIKLLQEAQENSRALATKEVRCYKTSFTPPKKVSRPKECSANVQKLMGQMDDKTKRKMLRIPKINKTTEKPKAEKPPTDIMRPIECDRESRYGVDEDDYVSKEASELYGRLMAKYNKMPDDSGGFPPRRKRRIDSKKAGRTLEEQKQRVRFSNDKGSGPRHGTPNPTKAQPSTPQGVKKNPPPKHIPAPGQTKILKKKPENPDKSVKPPPIDKMTAIQILKRRRAIMEESIRHKSQARPRVNICSKKKIKKRVIISDSEDEEELENFVVDTEDDGIDVSKAIKEIFGYDRSKFSGKNEEPCEESSFAEQMKEERISGKLGLLEEIEDINNEIQMKMKKRRWQGNAGGLIL